MKKWTEEQLVEVLRLYCRTEFGKIHNRNPSIIELAKKLERTPSSVSLKMSNFAALDPTIDRKGMSNFSALDRETWNKFFANIDAYIINEATQEPHIENSSFNEEQAVFELDIPFNLRSGYDVNVEAKQRIGQSFFRSMVIASYDGKCAATNVDSNQLLVASHIVPWSKNKSVRLDPSNGICLNALFDRAFDRGLISFSDTFKILYSSSLPKNTKMTLQSMTNGILRLPSKFQPNIEYLKEHREQFRFE